MHHIKSSFQRLVARLDMVLDTTFQFNTMYNVTGYLQFSTTVTAVLQQSNKFLLVLDQLELVILTRVLFLS